MEQDEEAEDDGLGDDELCEEEEEEEEEDEQEFWKNPLQPSKNASLPPAIPRNTPETKAPASAAETKSPASAATTKSPASAAGTKSPASAAKTQSPASAAETQSPASAAETKSPANACATKAPAPTATTDVLSTPPKKPASSAAPSVKAAPPAAPEALDPSIPDRKDGQASKPAPGEVTISPDAMRARARRVFTPRANGTLKVSKEVFDEWQRGPGSKERKNLEMIFQQCGYDPETIIGFISTAILFVLVACVSSPSPNGSNHLYIRR